MVAGEERAPALKTFPHQYDLSRPYKFLSLCRLRIVCGRDSGLGSGFRLKRQGLTVKSRPSCLGFRRRGGGGHMHIRSRSQMCVRDFAAYAGRRHA